MSKILILIKGKKNTGKNFVASYLKKYLQESGLKVEETSFALPLKQILSDIMKLSIEQIEEYKNEKSSPIRRYLQDLGTSLRERFSEDIFVEKVHKTINEFDGDIIIVTDFRYKNECYYFKNPKEDLSVITIEIENLNVSNNDKHSSENDLNDFVCDYVVDNSIYLNNEAEAIEYLYPKFKEIVIV